MRKPFLVKLTLIMLASVTLYNFYAAFGILVISGRGNINLLQSWQYIISLLFVLLPPFVLIRKLSFPKWTMTDSILVWLGVVPGLYFICSQALKYDRIEWSDCIIPIAYTMLGSLTTLLTYLDRLPRIPNSSGDAPETE